MSQPIISVRDLSKVYRLGEIGVTSLREEATRKWHKVRGKEQAQDEGEFWALRDVSFDIQPGEIVGIIGKNGAGKSTLLKVISRITEPTHGEIRLRGRVAALLEVGTGFHPELTGRENIYLNGTILGMKKREIDRKLDEIIEFSGITKHIDTPVKRYSSGMNVRLGFAVAAHLEPEILIVDEVLAVGDAEFQKKCLGKMKDVAGNGRTVLFVSHNMGAVATLCERGIVLQGGQVCYQGTATDAIDEYALSIKSAVNSVEDARLPGYSQKARIVDVRLNSKKEILNLDESLEFEVSMSNPSKLGNLKIAGAIFTSTGTAVGSFFSHDPISFNVHGEASITLSIHGLPLAPGHYHAGFSIGTGALDEPRNDLDVVVGIPNFEISSVGETRSISTNWDHRNWGPLSIREVTVQQNSI